MKKKKETQKKCAGVEKKIKSKQVFNVQYKRNYPKRSKFQSTGN